MKTLILGATGFMGRNISQHFPNAHCVGSDHHNFELGLGTDKFDHDYDVIINCVGKYGGLPYNQKHGTKIFFDNTTINNHINQLIEKIKPKRYVRIYSACMYPSVDYQVTEQILNTGYQLAESVKWSALPQLNDLSYLKQSNLSFDALVVTNCYGYHDHYDHEKSHIIGSLLTKIRENKDPIQMIGTGTGKRDFVFAGDVGKVINKLLKVPSSNSALNVSSGVFLSIKEVVDIIIQKYGYQGKIIWGEDKDNGVLFKGLDNTDLVNKIGQFEFTLFENGILDTIGNFKQFLP